MLSPASRRWLRRLGLIAAGLFVLLLIVVSLLPTLLSTGPGRGFVQGMLPKGSTLGSLKLRWLGGQRVENLRIVTTGANAVDVDLAELDLPDASLLGLVRGDRDLGLVRVVARTIDVTLPETGPDETTTEPAPAPAPAPREPAEPFRLPDGLAVQLELAIDRLTVKRGQTQELTLQGTRVETALSGADPITGLVRTKVRSGDLSGDVEADWRVESLFARDGSLQTDQAKLDIATALRGIPMAALDALAGDARYTALLGPSLEAKVTLKGTLNDLTAELLARSDRLTSDLRMNADPAGTLAVTSGNALTLTVTPQAFALWQKGPAALVEPFDLRVRIDRFTATRQDNTLALDTAALTAGVTLDPIQLSLSGGEGKPTRQLTARTNGLRLTSDALGERVNLEADLTLSEASLAQALPPMTLSAQVDKPLDPKAWAGSARLAWRGVSAVMLDQLAQQQGTVAMALGGDLDFGLDLAYAADERGAVKLRVQSPAVNLGLQGAVEQGLFTLDTQQSGLAVTVSPELLAKFQEAVKLTAPARVVARFDALSLPVEGFDPARASLGFNVAIEGVALDHPTLKVDKVALTWPTATLDQDQTPRVELVLRGGEAVGRFDAQATLVSLTDKPQVPRAGVKAADLPVGLLRSLLPTEQGKYLTLIGERIDSLDVALRQPQPGEQTFTLAMRSTHLAADVAGRMRAGESVVIEPGQLAKLNLTPEAFAAVMPESKLRLEKPLPLTVEARQLIVPLGGQAAPPRVDLSLTTPGSTLRDTTQADVTVELGETVLSLRSEDARKQVDVDASLRFRRPGTQEEGKLGGKVVLRDGLDEAMKFNQATASAELDLRGEALRMDVIDALMNQKGVLVASVGPTSDLSAKGRWPGDLDVTFTSPLATLGVPATLDREMVLTLREPLRGSLTVTPALSQAMLSQVHPVMADMISSQAPVRLTLDQPDFQLPLRDFDLSRAALSGTLELGTVDMKHSGWLRKGLMGMVGEALKVIGGGRADTSNPVSYPVKMSPLTFQLKDGVVTTNEPWIAAADMAVGFRGTFDLKRNTMDMTMGVPGATFIRLGGTSALGEVIKPGEVFEIPVKGSMSSPSIDAGWLTLQLAGSFASLQAHRAGGEAGKLADLLLGTVGEAIKGGGGDPLRFNWQPSADAVAFVQKVEEERPIESRLEQTAKPGEQAAPQGQERPKPADVLRDLFKRDK